ncbi:hypothetical protein D9756_009674 [Leucocoprinus leucothites]|uniref:Uncharacterized protein n=1 Tax=Leucocoprinus leucothites TaxID=201217 RepID=A0A8H5CVS1_9AGAR|nr:hypothetical protein D9756_009674 [Leucoagaricus leucothites]
MGSLLSRLPLPEPSSNTARSQTCPPKRSPNTTPTKRSSNTSQPQSRPAKQSNMSQTQSRAPNHLSSATSSQPCPPKQSSVTSAPQSRPPEHSPGNVPPAPPLQVRPPEHSSDISPSQASPHKNSPTTMSQPSNGKTVNYTLDSIARRNAQLDRDEEELHECVVVTEGNDQKIMNWIHALRQDENELTQRSITDCVCRHEPSCPNSRIFPCLKSYSRFNTSPVSALLETPNHARIEERFKRRKQSEDGTDRPPGYQESNPSKHNGPPGTSTPGLSTTSSSGSNLQTSQFDLEGCSHGNTAVTGIMKGNELEEAYKAVERRADRLEKLRKETDQIYAEQRNCKKEGEDWMVQLRIVRFRFERRAGECTCRRQGNC